MNKFIVKYYMVYIVIFSCLLALNISNLIYFRISKFNVLMQ